MRGGVSLVSRSSEKYLHPISKTFESCRPRCAGDSRALCAS